MAESPPSTDPDPPAGTATKTSQPRQGGGTFESLRVRQFRRYMVSFVGSGIGFQSMLVATGWLAWDLTRSELMLSLILLMSGLTQVFAAPAGGVLSDRLPQKRVMIVMQTVLLANGLILGALVATDLIEVWHLFVSAGVFGAANSFQMPSRQSFVFNIVGREHLPNALALNSGAMSSMRLVGPAVGGVLIGQLGAEAVYFTVAGGYLLSILVLTLFITASGAPTRVTDASPVGALAEGIGYLARDPVLKWLVLGLMGGTLLGLPFRDLLPAFSDALGQGPEGFGWLLSMSGLGALMGSLVIATWSHMRNKGKIFIAIGVGFGAAVLVLSVMPSLATAMVVMVALGAISAGYNTINNILVQTHVEDAYRGRVVSFVMVMFGLHLVGAVLIGLVAEVTGIRWGLAGSGLAMMAFALYLGFGRSEIRPLQ